jgi:hypothetical protein
VLREGDVFGASDHEGRTFEFVQSEVEKLLTEMVGALDVASRQSQVCLASVCVV